MADEKNPALDNRTGDQVPSRAAWAKKPQHVDGGELNADAVKPVGERPERKSDEPSTVASDKLDSREGDALPPEEAFKSKPQHVDGGELGDEGVKPRG